MKGKIQFFKIRFDFLLRNIELHKIYGCPTKFALIFMVIKLVGFFQACSINETITYEKIFTL